MPTYEYACKSCGEHLEVVQSFTDESLDTCPACGGRLRKVFGSIGIAFKGSGFYRTDSRPAATKKDRDTEKATEKAGDKAKAGSGDGASAKEGASSSKTSDSSSSKSDSSSGSTSDAGSSSKKPGGGDPKPGGDKAPAAATS